VKSLVNYGQLAMQSKPRRCHYTGGLFCHSCHTNKRAMLPALVTKKWTFEEEHVSNKAANLLATNMHRPLIHLPTMVLESVRENPTVTKVLAMRRRLHRMHAIIRLCPERGARANILFTTSYYFTRENWWSLSDLIRLRLLEPDAPRALAKGLINPDLMQALSKHFNDALEHIQKCASGCREKAFGSCALCSGAAPVSFFEDGACCSACGRLSHAGCLSLMACKCGGVPPASAEGASGPAATGPAPPLPR
jgi:hypothetical protein